MHFFFAVLCVLTSAASAEIELPDSDAAQPIVVSARGANRWQLGAYDVWVLRGDCTLQQGRSTTRCREAVLWIDRAESGDGRPHKVIAYLEGDVKMLNVSQGGESKLTDQAWFGRFYSFAGVEVRAATTAGRPNTLPPIYWRGMEWRDPEPKNAVQPAQYTENAASQGHWQDASATPAANAAPPTVNPRNSFGAAPITLPSGVRRIRVSPRSNVPVQVKWSNPSGTQWIGVIHSGVNVIIDTEINNVPVIGTVGTVDFSADRVVIWTQGDQFPDLNGARQDERVPLEFYLEGDIVFRQDDRVVQAERMYYDATNLTGTILNADMLTPVDKYQGLLRLHADVIRQVAPTRFFVENAFMTSSRMGEPRYRLQTGELYFEDTKRAVIDPLTGQAVLDPTTGQPAIDHQRLATATDNVIYLGPVPVFYWPRLATDLNDPTYYIRRAQLKQDNVYGTQVLTNWSGYELLGIRKPPEGTDLDIELDYLGKRGLGHGGAFTYDREGFFGIPGQTAGLADYWGIKDHGRDDLGQGRMNLVPEKSYRYRLFWQHRHVLPYDMRLSVEAGWISDNNFLEEYFKREWETLKDQTTSIELKQITANRDWSVYADYRINDFFTQTSWLPRADHYWIGQSLFNDVFTWHEHSQVGYAKFNRLTPPTNPVADGPFNYLPWEQNTVRGERFVTRQEIDWPLQLGVVKVVPYAMGEAAHWGEDINGQRLDRLWGQVGARASVPVWSVDPTAHNELLNVHGLAHKIVFDMEFSYAEANKDMYQLPLYDPVDDDAQEAYRRRFLTYIFGIPSPLSPMPVPAGTPWPGTQPFDERYYALRTGLQSWVTSPSTEIADDLTVFRLGARQRWQTKRGPPHNRHIIDWVTLDSNISIFPEPGRDDYGQTFGLADYNFNWHVGDRVTLVSSGIFDFFNRGQQIVSVGGFLNRPPRGSLYAGFRILEGPMHGKILTLSYNYWMSPKWVSAFGTSIDLGNQGNLGQNFRVTRVGESFLISFGFNVDRSRDSVGVGLAIEPRFLPKNRLGRIGGAQIPPAGALGLE